MFDTVKSKDFIHACEKPSTLLITKKALSSIKVLLIKWTEWLKKKIIKVLQWLNQNSDLNPTKMLRQYLKQHTKEEWAKIP